MKVFLKQNVWPVVAGFIAASVVMMAFEFTNSFMFAFPPGLDTNNLDALRAFAAQQSPQIFYMVLAGWIAGSFVGGYVATRLSGETTYSLSAIVGVLLLCGGIANHLMLQHPLWFNSIAFPSFFIFSYFGHKYFQN